MKHLTLVILLALAPLSWGNEPLVTTPFKCTVEYKGGVMNIARRFPKTATEFMNPKRIMMKHKEEGLP
jgi:hypothetical protein